MLIASRQHPNIDSREANSSLSQTKRNFKPLKKWLIRQMRKKMRRRVLISHRELAGLQQIHNSNDRSHQLRALRQLFNYSKPPMIRTRISEKCQNIFKNTKKRPKSKKMKRRRRKNRQRSCETSHQALN